jgi:restriction system protein
MRGKNRFDRRHGPVERGKMPVMNLKMNQNSIFAVLLRSPWWISGGIALALFTAARLALPAEFALYAFFIALPFAVIAAYTAWQALRAPSETRVAQAIEAVRALSWAEFSRAVSEAFARDGYTVQPIAAGGADFALVKSGRTTLVGCKRWKAARTGIEPLRELESAKRSREAHECIYIATGDLTDTARAFAAQNNIRLMTGPDLMKAVPLAKRA